MRTRFLQNLAAIRADVERLGLAVEQSLERSLHAVESGNVAIARWVIENDRTINMARRTLEERVTTLLATQQPIVAADLRLLLVVIAISAELERIGDYAANIARRMNDTPTRFTHMQLPADFATLTTLARDMLHTSITAFVEQDLDQARALSATDEQVDALHATLREHLIARIAAAPQETATATDVLDMVHLLERTADRAENIGERVIYLITSNMDAIH